MGAEGSCQQRDAGAGCAIGRDQRRHTERALYSCVSDSQGSGRANRAAVANPLEAMGLAVIVVSIFLLCVNDDYAGVAVEPARL